MQTLANGKLKFEREDDLISVVGTANGRKYSIEVTDSLVNGEAVIHIIDDFVNIDTTFFPLDPGSIMERLLTDEASTISDSIRYTRWYRKLGNSEGEWTVFVPLFSFDS